MIQFVHITVLKHIMLLLKMYVRLHFCRMLYISVVDVV